MKKLFTVLALLVSCALLLSSCGEDSFLVKYNEDEIGLHYELPESLEYYRYGEKGTYKNYRNEAGSVAVVICYYENSLLAENDSLSADVNIEEYLNYMIAKNTLGEIDIQYNDAKTRATFDLLVTNPDTMYGQYTYYTVIRGEGGIYVVQMLCTDAIYETYAPQFARWSNYIYTY